MRTLGAGLLAAQRTSGKPATYLTVGGVDYASRAEKGRHIERPYGGRATILLENSDKSITTDYRGEKVVIGYGFEGDGNSKAAPLWVLTQQDVSYEGEVAVQLECIDIWLKLSLLRIVAGGGVQLDGTIAGSFQPGMKVTGQTSGATATVIYTGDGYIAVSNVAKTFSTGETVQSDVYSTIQIVVTGTSNFGGGSPPCWNGDKTILEIIQQLTSGVVTVVLDSSDGVVDVYKPNYETVNNARVLDIIMDLMAKTTCAIRAENDDDLHVLDITSAPGSPDYTYDTDHSFFSNLRDTSSILPNRIIVVSAVPSTTGMTTYTGSAVDAAAKARFGIWITLVITANVTSDAEADQVAASMLSRVQMEATRGTIEVPMNCGQELFDYPRIDDNRADIDYQGRIGSLEHIWEPGTYRLIIGLGNLAGGERLPPEDDYPLPNIIPEVVPGVQVVPTSWVIPAAIQGFHHDLHFVADDYNTVSWESGTIKFYDGTEQSIDSGSYNIPNALVHYIYFDLDDASPEVLKTTSDYLSVMSVKTGVVCMTQRGSSSEVSATVIPSYGKEPLLTPDVIYITGEGVGGDKLSTLIYAGSIHLRRSTTEFENEWYRESGVEIDARHGINIYGEDNAFTTRRTRTGTIQCKVDSHGRIVAGAGDVILDQYGISIYGESLKFKRGSQISAIWQGSDGDLRIDADRDILMLGNTYMQKGVFPIYHEHDGSGASDAAWSQVVGYRVFSEDGAIHAYQEQDDIALLKAIKSKVKDGRQVIDGKTLPQDIVTVNKKGQNYVNLGGLSGLNIGIMKALLARIEALEDKGGKK